MARLGRDGTAGSSTGGSRAFINNLNRVRKNTNAVASVTKPSSSVGPKALTNNIQKSSVKKVSSSKSTPSIFAPKKVVAKKKK